MERLGLGVYSNTKRRADTKRRAEIRDSRFQAEIRGSRYVRPVTPQSLTGTRVLQWGKKSRFALHAPLVHQTLRSYNLFIQEFDWDALKRSVPSYKGDPGSGQLAIYRHFIPPIRGYSGPCAARLTV